MFAVFLKSIAPDPLYVIAGIVAATAACTPKVTLPVPYHTDPAPNVPIAAAVLHLNVIGILFVIDAFVPSV
jgi:hypothetical protein